MAETHSTPSSEGLGEGSGVPKVLARNSACHQCRKRKLKCDAVRPVCTNCVRPRPRSGGLAECTWDEKKESGRNRTRRKKEDGEETAAKKARLNELEERVAAFEKALQQQNSGAQQTTTTNSPSIKTGDQQSAAAPVIPHQSIANEPQAHYDPVLNAFPIMGKMEELSSASWTPPSSFKQSTGPSPDTDFSAPATGIPNTLGAGKENLVDNVYDLVWPDWPQDLPTLEVVEHIAGVFFDKVPTVPKMLHRATFMNNLQLPPNHYNFPARALLHAILAVTAPHLPPTELAKRSYFPIGSSYTDIQHPEIDFEPSVTQYRHLSSAFHTTAPINAVTPLGRFQMWHRRKTFSGLAIEFDSGEKLLQALQAQIIVTTLDAYNAWWTDLWMEAGGCIRMATPLRLNESPNTPDDVLPRFKHVLIRDAATPHEQAMRDRTWWMAYLTERSVNMSTTWPESLHDEEITVELPVIQANFDSGIGELQGVQTLHSPNLLSSHPPQHCDGFVFYIKALKLWSDTTKWFRRYCRGKHTVSGYLAQPNLRLFLSQINAFRMTFPQHLRKPTQGLVYGKNGVKSMDVDLIASIMITHATTLALGEPLITKDMHNSDVAKMSLSAIRAVLSLLYDITSTSFDLSLLPHSCSFVWCLCSRGLCRFIDAAQLNGDMVSASVFQAELEVFRLAMSQHGERYPVANRHLKMVDELIKLQAESTALSFGIDVNCTKDQIFDPDYIPSADPSRKGTGSGSMTSSTPSALTPPVATGSIIGRVRNTIPGGFAPSARSGQVGNPSKEFWTDTYPTANAENFWNDSNMLNQQEANIQLISPPLEQPQVPVHQQQQQLNHQTQQLPQQQQQQQQQQPQQSPHQQHYSFSSTAGVQPTIVPELNIDIGSWFDIANFSFDVDALNSLANAVDPNATFQGSDFTFRMQ